MPKSLFCLFLMVFSMLLLQAEYFDEFRNRLLQQDWETAEGMIKDYLATSKDVEAMRELQDIWLEKDPEGCQNYFFDAVQQNPGPVWDYLLLRLEDNEEYQAEQAYQLCIKHPDFYWGYRVLLLNLLSIMLEEEYELSNPLNDRTNYLKVIDAGYERFPQDDYFHLFQFYRYHIEGENAKALACIRKLKNEDIILANWQRIQYSLILKENLELYQELVPGWLALGISKQEISSADSLMQYAYGHLSILMSRRDFSAVLSYLQRHENLLENWAYRDDWLTARAEMADWGELSKDLLGFANSYKLQTGELKKYLEKWQTQLSSLPEWKELQAKSGP